MAETRISKNDLDERIKAVVTPTVKELLKESMGQLGKDVVEIIQENVKKTVEHEKEALKQNLDPKAFKGGDNPHGESTEVKYDKMRKTNERMLKADPAGGAGLDFARLLRAAAHVKLNNSIYGSENVLSVLKKWGYPEMVDRIEKTLAAGDPAEGGILVPDEFSEDVIEVLRPKSVVRMLNPMTLPMARGNLQIPKITEGSNSYYIGENRQPTVSGVKTGLVRLTAKKLATLVPMSNDLIRQASVAADMYVRNDMVRSMATKENGAFLRGDGINDTPLGLRQWAKSDNVFRAAEHLDTSGTGQNVDDKFQINLHRATSDMGKAVLRLENNNIMLSRPAWIVNPTVKWYLETAQTAIGNFLYRDQIMNGQFWGYPIGCTTQMPNNLGENGNESEIYFVDMDDVAIGDTMSLMVDLSSEAAYEDGGTVVSAFGRDQTVIRALAEHDIAMRREESIAVVTGVNWGRWE